ncbi:MAG: hypothetical protein LC749_13295 [Actinobacteria bacterium]|nr:hypothetical protein [Actinomycetota bacterium]
MNGIIAFGHRRGYAAVAVALAVAACGGAERNTDIRQWTNDMAFRVSVTPMPPVAESMTTFKVVVQDKTSGQPIETGEGRIFATSPDRAEAYDGLSKGKEVGTYYAHIRFPVSGEWSIGMQFRRDSTKTLERTQDWQQTVLMAAPVAATAGSSRNTNGTTDTTKR